MIVKGVFDQQGGRADVASFSAGDRVTAVLPLSVYIKRRVSLTLLFMYIDLA